MTADRAADAQLALACMMAESAYDPAHPEIIQPPLDSRLASRYTLRGNVTAQDAVFRREIPLGTQRVFYGWLLEETAAPGRFLLVIRGTAGGVEWCEDATGLPMAYGISGARVHRGFYELYRTFLYTAAGTSTHQPALSGVAGAVSSGSVTVVGHSLGSALASYWAYELADIALLGSRVSVRLFASPRPGDGHFADLFAVRIKDAIAYAFDPDLVPKVPFGFGYTPLHCLQEIEPAAAAVRIKMNPDCCHHAYSYCALLSPEIAASAVLTIADATFHACLLS